MPRPSVAGDLAALLGAQPTTVTVGEPWQVIWGVENVGATSYPPSQEVHLYLSINPILADEETELLLDTWETTATLPAGSYEETTSFFSEFPDVAPGTWYLIAWVNEVDAFNANDAASRAITVTGPSWQLSVSRTGSGDGTVTSIDPGGIACGDTCSADFGEDIVVHLTAVASAGSTFLGWTGACAGTGACNVTMTQDRQVTAEFALDVVAGFTFSPESPQAGQAVQFADASTSDPSGWQWDFGDGSPLSTQQHPLHSYEAVGSYQVEMLVSNAHSSDSITKTVTVSSSVSVLGAAFAFSPPAPVTGEAVQFTDQSTGNPVSWSWELGDGAVSALRNPSHTYGAAGEYLARLTVTAPGDSDTTTRTVTVAQAPDGSGDDPNLDVGPEEDFVPEAVRPEAPRVVFGPDGGKAVVWFQLGAGGSSDIRVQFFDAEGHSITEPRLVNQLPGEHRTPTAAFDKEGNLLILWTRDEQAFARHADRLGLAAAQGSSVLGRSFAPNGQAQSGEGSVSSGATGESAKPESDSDRSGNSVVVWQDGGKVRARLLDHQGNPRGSVFDVNTGNSGSDPTLAVSASGDFVVAWQGLSANSPAIFVRRYRDDGAAKGAGERVSSDGSPSHAAAGIDDAGNFIVAWDADGPGGRDIFTQRYSANGTKRGGIRQANAHASGDQTRPRVDVNAKGRFAIVWESTEGAAGNAASIQGQSVLGRVFDPQGDPERAEQEIATTEAGSAPEKPDVSLDEKDDMSVVYERRGPGGQSEGIFRRDIAVTTPPATCVADDNTLCLNGGRFRVTALWEEPNTRQVTSGRAVSLTGDTGFFWFFDSDNVEVVVKALAACPVNARFWVFAAGLTNVEVTLRVDDVITGQSNTYFNERNEAYLPILDSDAFATCDAESAPSVALTNAEVAAVREQVLAGLLTLAADNRDEPRSAAVSAADAGSASTFADSTNACATDSDSLCLAARFLVEVDFSTPGGVAGRGQAVELTNDTGYFWFFDDDNVEIVIKVLDACSIAPGRFWVFAAGLTNVEATLTVLDSSTGAQRVYENRLGTSFVPIQDTDAFATCP